MSIDFWHSTNDNICVNPTKTIRRISPQITSMKSGTEIGFGHNSSDGIPPRNIRILGLLDRNIPDFTSTSTIWHGSEKSQNENLGNNRILKNSEGENNFEVEKVGRKHSVILNHVSLNNIKVKPNHSNSVYSNHVDSNNDSDGVHTLNWLFS